jgi:hypothetical protein
MFATCSGCHRVMSGTSCDALAIAHPNGTTKPRLRYGPDEGITWSVPDRCNDCNTPLGGYHHVNCDGDICPSHGQVIGSRTCRVAALKVRAIRAPEKLGCFPLPHPRPVPAKEFSVTDSAISNCQRCGGPIEPEARRGPRRKLCRACAVPAVYQQRWLATRPDYRPAHNAARRVAYPPRECVGCGLTFVPPRHDSRFCCLDCRVHARWYGPYKTAESRHAHRIARHPGGRA